MHYTCNKTLYRSVVPNDENVALFPWISVVGLSTNSQLRCNRENSPESTAIKPIDFSNRNLLWKGVFLLHVFRSFWLIDVFMSFVFDPIWLSYFRNWSRATILLLQGVPQLRCVFFSDCVWSACQTGKNTFFPCCFVTNTPIALFPSASGRVWALTKDHFKRPIQGCFRT